MGPGSLRHLHTDKAHNCMYGGHYPETSDCRQRVQLRDILSMGFVRRIHRGFQLKALLGTRFRTINSWISLSFVQHFGLPTMEQDLYLPQIAMMSSRWRSLNRSSTSVFEGLAQVQQESSGNVPCGNPILYSVSGWLRAISRIHSLTKPLIWISTPSSRQK